MKKISWTVYNNNNKKRKYLKLLSVKCVNKLLHIYYPYNEILYNSEHKRTISTQVNMDKSENMKHIFKKK